MTVAALLIIMVVAFALRLYAFRTVKAYSPADERIYAGQAAWVSVHGPGCYHAFVREWLGNPSLHEFPSPLRWGYLGLAAAWLRLKHSTAVRALALLSTFCGIGTVIASLWLARDLVGDRAALFAAALVACSALQLGLGRRALSDSPATLVAVLYLLAVVRYAHGAGAWSAAGAVVAGALAIAMKESALALVVPAAAVLLAAIRGPWALGAGDVAVICGPVAAWLVLSSVVVGGPRPLASLLLVGASAQGKTAYSRAYQAGPAYRPVVDLLLVAPAACLLAAFGLAGGMSPLGWAFAASLGLAGLVPLKNARLMMVAEVLACILAGQALAGMGSAGALVAVVACAVGLWTFWKVFLAGQVYDPVTANVTHALGMSP